MKEFYQTFQAPTLHKLFQRLENKRKLSISFKVTIISISKPNKDRLKFRPILILNINSNILFRVSVNRFPIPC